MGILQSNIAKVAPNKFLDFAIKKSLKKLEKGEFRDKVKPLFEQGEAFGNSLTLFIHNVGQYNLFCDDKMEFSWTEQPMNTFVCQECKDSQGRGHFVDYKRRANEAMNKWGYKPQQICDSLGMTPQEFGFLMNGTEHPKGHEGKLKNISNYLKAPLFGNVGDPNVSVVSSYETFLLLLANEIGPMGAIKQNKMRVLAHDGKGALYHTTFLTKFFEILRESIGL